MKSLQTVPPQKILFQNLLLRYITNNQFPPLSPKSTCFCQLPLSCNLELLIGLPMHCPILKLLQLQHYSSKTLFMICLNFLMISVNFTSAEKSCLIFSLSSSSFTCKFIDLKTSKDHYLMEKRLHCVAQCRDPMPMAGTCLQIHKGTTTSGYNKSKSCTDAFLWHYTYASATWHFSQWTAWTLTDIFHR